MLPLTNSCVPPYAAAPAEAGVLSPHTTSADDDDVLLPEASGKAVITGAECTSSKLSYVLRGKSCVAAAASGGGGGGGGGVAAAACNCGWKGCRGTSLSA